MHSKASYTLQMMFDGALNAVFIQSHQLPLREFVAKNGDTFTWEFKANAQLANAGVVTITDRKGDVTIKLDVFVNEHPVRVHTFMTIHITRDSNLTITDAMEPRLQSVYEYAHWALSNFALMDEDELSVVNRQYV